MQTIETIKFGQYHALKLQMLQPDFDCSKQKDLNFQSKEYTDTPPERALRLLPQLRILNLSNNRIDRFNPQNLIKGAPLLQELDLSRNILTTLEDVVELGALKHLKRLQFHENPVMKRLVRIKIIEFLLFPGKYQPYNAVNILTATYNYVPNDNKLDCKRQQEIKDFERIRERDIDEIKKEDFKSFKPIKQGLKDSLLKLSHEPCPVPRKTRFPMLKLLNGEAITVLDIQSILMSDNIDQILPVKDVNKSPKKTQSRNRSTEKGKKKMTKEDTSDDDENTPTHMESASNKNEDPAERLAAKKKRELHEQYLEKYRRRQFRKDDEARMKHVGGLLKELETKKGGDELHILYQLDQADFTRRKMKKPSEEAKLWEKPVDLQYKDAEYNVSIKDHKKMLRDYEENKIRMKEERIRRKKIHLEKIRALAATKNKKKRRNKEFEGITQENEEELVLSFDSDPEVKMLIGSKGYQKPKQELEPGLPLDADPELRKLFGLKIKRRPKLNFDMSKDYKSLDSKESEIDEWEEDSMSHASLSMIVAPYDKKSKTTEELTVMIQTNSPQTGSKKEKETKPSEMKTLGPNSRMSEVVDYGSEEQRSQSRIVVSRSDLSTPLKKAKRRNAKNADAMRVMFGLSKKASVKFAKVPKAFFVTHESMPNLALPIYQREARQVIEQEGHEQEEKDVESKASKLVQKEEEERVINNEIKISDKPSEDEISMELLEIISHDKEKKANSEEDKLSPMSKNDVGAVSIQDEQASRFLEEDMKVPVIKEADFESIKAATQIELTLKEKNISSISREVIIKINEKPSRKSSNVKIASGSNLPEPSHQKIPKFKEKLRVQVDEEENKPEMSEAVKTPATKVTLMSLQATMGSGDFSHSGKKLTEFTSPDEPMLDRSAKILSVLNSTRSVRPMTSAENLRRSSGTPQSFRQIGCASSQPQTARALLGLDFVPLGKSPGMTEKQVTLKNQAIQLRIQTKSSFKLSNKVFFRHQPQSSSTRASSQLPSRVLTHRQLKSPDTGSTRRNSVQWTPWTPHNRSPIKETEDHVLTTPTQVPTTHGSQNIKTTAFLMRQPKASETNSAKLSQISIVPPQSHRESVAVGKEAKPEANVVERDPFDTRIKKTRRNNIKETPKIIVKGPLKTSNVLLPEKRVSVESLIPKPQDGVSERMRVNILNDKEGKYARLLETAKMLDETTLLIQQAQEISDKVQVTLGHRKAIAFPDRIINYEQLAEFLRKSKKADTLTYEDNAVIRELIYLANEFDRDNEMKLSKLGAETRLRDLKQMTVNIDEKALQGWTQEIGRLNEYLEILGNIEAGKENGKNAKQLKRIEKKEIERAESNALLAAHCMKLSKYYGEAYISKYFQDHSTVIANMEAMRPAGAKVEFAHKVIKTPNSITRPCNMGVFLESEPLYINKKSEETDNAQDDVDQKKLEEFEPRWLKVTRVERYAPKPMYTFEELTEVTMRKKDDERNKAGHRLLTVEEKMIKYVEDLKENAKKRKDLKARIEKHVQNGRKDINEFLKTQRIENDRLHDKAGCFREYVELIWENKI